MFKKLIWDLGYVKNKQNCTSRDEDYNFWIKYIHRINGKLDIVKEKISELKLTPIDSIHT